MINPTGKKLQDLTSKLIDGEIEGVDKYTLNGSTWLIFTDQKRWVVEYTEDGILWYNYSFFTEIFEILGMKATDNQNLIQEWFESKFLRPQISDIECSPNPPHDHAEEIIQNGVKNTSFSVAKMNDFVEDTIQNGVKHTERGSMLKAITVEDTIQNGVKHTFVNADVLNDVVEDTIQKGVKRTIEGITSVSNLVEDTIQNGVKSTLKCLHRKSLVEDTIKNGVKHTERGGMLKAIAVEDTIQNGVKTTRLQKSSNLYRIEDTIQNGVKDTKLKSGNQTGKVEHTLQKGVKETCESKSTKSISLRLAIQNGVKHCEDGDWLDGDERFEDIIQNGVKEMQPLPAQDGNRDWGKYYHGKEDRTKPHTEYVKDVIKIGEKLN